MAKDRIKVNQVKDEQIVNQVNDALFNLRNNVIRKEIPENENPDKVIDIVEKIVDFGK